MGTGSRDRLVDLDGWNVPPSATKSVSRSNSQKSFGSPSKYPVLSTRQSTVSVPRSQPSSVRQFSTNPTVTRHSPSKYTPVNLSPSSHASPSRFSLCPLASNDRDSPSGSLSASFQMPVNLSDASLIRDCSFAGASESSNGDDSMDLFISELRPGLPNPSALGYQSKQVKEGSITPTKATRAKQDAGPQETAREPVSALTSFRAMRYLNESTLLPSSPGKSAHLLTSTNAIVLAEPPWTDGCTLWSEDGHRSLVHPSSVRRSKSAQVARVSPRRPAATGSAMSFASTAVTSSVTTSINPKRTFPASSSGSSLASVGEVGGHHLDPDVSTLLPVSPEKLQHLLRKEEMINQETLVERPSFRIPEKRSPVETTKTTPSSGRTVTKGGMDVGDVTLDVRDLVAKMSKSKRASGTEESFADLLHGRDGFEAADVYVALSLL